MQLQKLNNGFIEVHTELLLCVACLNPCDSFSTFDYQRLIQLAQFYPKDFSAAHLLALFDQPVTYIADMRSCIEFWQSMRIYELSQKIVETKRDYILIGLQACYFGIGLTYCNCYSGGGHFCSQVC